MIKFIAHRANYDGDCKNENTFEKIIECFDLGYEVEIDLWYEKEKFLLGHDKGVEEIMIDFLIFNCDFLWIHCKNLECFEMLSTIPELNIFYHTNEAIVLTSKKYVWTYPGQHQIKNSILVLPEIDRNDVRFDIRNIAGICSDNIQEYKCYMENSLL